MRIFLSYNNRDREVAERLQKALLRRRPDLEIYFAPVRNTIGAYWIAELGEELEATDAVLLLLGNSVGAWQELEYYEALKASRKTKRPLIAPIMLGETLPGLHFLDHFQRFSLDRQPFEDLVTSVLTALDGAPTEDEEPLWRRTNPYRGLPAMRSEDAAYFFGRDKITSEILDALRQDTNRVIALVGNSGVGKSSIAQAGVLASLRSRLWPGDLDREWPSDLETSPAWLHISVTPGELPLKALAQAFARIWLDDPADVEEQALRWVKLFREGDDLSALTEAARNQVARQSNAEPPPRTLIYVDQGEELYARAEAEEAEICSRLLAEAVVRPEIAIMLSIRSDHYGHLQEDAPLFEACERIDVPPMDREQIECMIREPAARLGVRFENPEMVPPIAEATAREKGALPMLSYLMSDVWETMRQDDRADGTLRFPYEIVDVSRPLVERAERFLAEHPHSKAILRRLFTLKLAHVPKEGEAVRRRARRSECSEEEWELADALAGPEWRLLSTGEEGEEPTLEVSHEALLRNWPRLELWLDAAREFLIWKGHLEADRRAWELAAASDKPRALLTGLRLDGARFWRGERGDDLSEADRTFIDASISTSEDAARRRKETRERVAQQRKWIARLAATAAIVFAVFGGLATWQWDEADLQRSSAEAALNHATRETERANNERQRAEKGLRRAQIEQARFRAIKAQELTAMGDAGAAIGIALSGMPYANPSGWPSLDHIREVPIALADALFNRRELAVLRGHGGGVNCAAFSPGGARIVTASEDKTAWIWNAENGSKMAVLRGHEGGVNSAAFSPGGARIVTASKDSTARIWNAENGAELAVLRGHKDDIYSATFSPDGTRVVTASADNTARIWNVVSGTEIAVYRGHGGPVWSASFSPDGTRVVTASEDKTARIWVADSGAEVAVLRGHKDDIYSAAFSPDGTRVVTASDDETARIWDTESGAEIAVLRGHEDDVWSASFSPDGTRVVTASDDDTARIWNADSGAEVAVLSGYEGSVNSAVFSPDGTRVVIASQDNTAQIWNAKNGAEMAPLRSHEDEVNCAVFSPDGTRIVTASDDGTARIWAAGSGAEVMVLRVHKHDVNAAAFSPGSAQVATAAIDNTARIWDAASGAEVTVLRGHGGGVNSVAFSPDGTHVVTASDDDTARTWDAASGAAVAVLRGHEDDVNSAVFSPDDTRIVTASTDRSARIWDVESGAEITILRGHAGPVWSAAFSPDGTRIVTASEDKTARIWDADSGAEIAVLRGHAGPVWSAAFSPDGSRIVTASADRSARIWGSESGAEVAVLRGHGHDVRSAAFSPDGARIVTASWDNTARIWDVESGAEIIVLRGHAGSVNSASFSPGGTRIVTASDDDTARLWPHYQTMDELYEHAHQIVEQLQPLSEQEKCAYYLRREGCQVGSAQ